MRAVAWAAALAAVACERGAITAAPSATASASATATATATATTATASAAASASAPASVAAIASGVPCAGAGSVNVSLVYGNARESWGPVIVMKVVAPELGVERELARLGGPIDCNGTARGDVLEWRCSEDMGTLFGEVAVEGSAIVFRSAHDSGPAVPPAGGTAAPPPAPKEDGRAKWPCGARPSFHPKRYVNHP